MKASTLLAIAVALIVGLGVAGAARYTGLLKAEAPPPPSEQEKKPLPKVLVAVTPLYKDVAVSPGVVKVRDLRPDELPFFESNRGKFLVGEAAVAHMRVPTRTVAADQPLLEEYFQEVDLPKSISNRLEPGTRSVNVTVDKDRGQGGVIQVGEYVDVFLTSIVAGGNPAEAGPRTACIARECKVVMKRNNLWTVMAASPDGQQLHYTLQANPYRAALIEYAPTAGHLTLVPVPAPTRKVGTFSDPSSREYADEEFRVESLTRGELAVGPADLVRVFQLKLEPPPSPVKIRHVVGVDVAGETEFTNGLPKINLTPAPKEQPHAAPVGVVPAAGAGAPGQVTSAAFTFSPPAKPKADNTHSLDVK